MQKLRYAIEYGLFITVIKVFQWLPPLVVLPILKGLFYIFGYVCGFRRAVVRRQLQLCFPEKEASEINRLLKEVYSELAVTVGEVFLFRPSYFKSKVEVVGYEEVRSNLEKGKGLIVVSAHFGNWELAAKMLATDIPPVYGIVKRQHNPYFNKYINATRSKAGIRTVDMHSALKPIISALQKNSIVAVLIDQYAFKHGVEMEFLGNLTKVYTSISQLALRYGVPVILAFDIRNRRGQHRIIYNKAMTFDSLEYNEENIYNVTRAINAELEACIIKYPHLWFWVHKKFR